ncbi:Predicted arabinose efflux permease, MFS family [Amycolatopsis tolypomycina]|uniref:Predicted arabinose efflux permease, MFS family n=1 Tax=Amycolatopsis tolypomycina TaxID=208445 RepID=A0A1H4WSX4_9PSEU|nr:MFS transporter [Amycolatopsis tolypomycina]SEC96482.1 Predicted arabinose efflux permease, MFS family [Amycolatopsis tolypomycina]
MNAPAPRWPAVFAVTVGIFAIVTTEILPIGLLTPIAAGFGVSAGTAVWTMTVPGFVAAVAAPVVTVAAGRLDRRLVLGGLLVLLALAGFLAAAAPAFWVLLAARFLVGVVIGGFWSIGAGLAPRLVGTAAAARATSVIFAAVPLGSVLGVPLGTLVGQLAGWRTAFGVLGVLSLGTAAALVALAPPLPPEAATRLNVLSGLLRRRGVRSGLLVTFLVVLAHFGTYTYVTPLLRDVVRPEVLSGYLLAYGAAGIVGTFLAGRYRAGFALAAAVIAAAASVLPHTGPIGALVTLVAWGVAYGAVPVYSQAWFAREAPDAPEAATVLFTASFQATISAGALAGGLVVDAVSVPAVMTCGGVAAAVAALGILGAGRRSPERAFR